MLCNHTVPKTCPQLDIEHGSVEVTRLFDRYEAIYTCDAGYKVRGWWYRNCNLLIGEWDETAPTCEECKLLECSSLVYLQGIT